MANPSGRLGSEAETAVTKVFCANGFPHCERRRLTGRYDQGDLAGVIGICVEIKGGTAAAQATDNKVDQWLIETEVERQNARADYGLLVMKRAGIGYARAADWWCVLPAWQFVSLIGKPGAAEPLHEAPVRLLLRDAITLLRLAGYGDALTDERTDAA